MDRLKQLRKDFGKTQKELADYLQISQSSYQSYEVGGTEPSVKGLIKLADLYGVSLDYLCSRNFSNEVGYLTQDQNAFVKAYLKLNEFDQAHVYGVVLGMLAKY